MRQRRIAVLLLATTLVAALVAQYYFAQLRDRFWDGVLLYGVALFCFARLLALRRRAEKTTPSVGAQVWGLLRQHPLRAWALAVGLLGLYTTVRLVEGEEYGQATLLCVLSIAAGLLAWTGLREEPLEEPERPAGPWAPWERWAVVGFALAGLLLRLPKVGTIPFVISGDEASMGIEALHVLEGSLRNPFATGWLSHPTLYFFLLAWPVAWLGRNAWGLRLFSPLVGAATLPILYLLARRLFDRRVALVATGLLTVAHLHIHFSRLAINNIYDPLFGLLAAFFLVRGLQEGRTLDFALGGLSLGLGQYFYMGGRLFPIMVAVYALVWILLHRPAGRRLWLPTTALGSAFLLTAGPLLDFFRRHPDDFLARLRMVGILQSGWLTTEQEVTGKSALELLWLQLRKSFFAFTYMHDPTSWYGAKLPYLDALSAVLFMLGLVLLVRHWRRCGYLLVNVWFWLALILGGMLIENPPSSARFVLFMPAVCLTAALGLVQVLDLLPFSRAWAWRVLAAVLLVAAGLNVGHYFFRYTPAGIFGGLNTEVGTRLGEYLSEQEAGAVVYFFGPPRMWIGYATIPFLAPNVEGVDVEEPLAGPPSPDMVDRSRPALFVFLPERAGELAWVQQAFPNGRQEEVSGTISGELLFIVYRVLP